MSFQGIPDFGTYKSAGQNLQAFTQLTLSVMPQMAFSIGIVLYYPLFQKFSR